MASAWGNSWASAWGNSFGMLEAVAEVAEPPTMDGGAIGRSRKKREDDEMELLVFVAVRQIVDDYLHAKL